MAIEEGVEFIYTDRPDRRCETCIHAYPLAELAHPDYPPKELGDLQGLLTCQRGDDRSLWRVVREDMCCDGWEW